MKASDFVTLNPATPTLLSPFPGKTGNGKSCWAEPDSNCFNVRGATYAEDGKKEPAGVRMFELLAVEGLKVEDRYDHVATRRGGVICLTPASPFPT